MPEDRNPAPGLFRRNPVVWGFSVAIGLLLAALLATTVVQLQSVLLSVFIAFFVTLGLDPLIRLLQRWGLKRAMAIITVIIAFVLVVAGLVWIVVPILVNQVTSLATSVPKEISRLNEEGCFDTINTATNGAATNALDWAQKTATDPNTWATVGGGALKVGSSVVNGVSTGLFVFILTLNFIATLGNIKKAGYSLINASVRPRFEEYAERIMASVGSYLNGMVVLAFINAVFSGLLLGIVGTPYAFIVAVICFFITLIPLIGTIITTIFMTVIALFTSPVAALIVLIAMLVYMQVEAYVLTPKVMSKAVQIPGSLVLIAALAGGTLLGLVGALVAIPLAAGVVLLVRELVVPKAARG
ncbi:AI-2E family transporter [Pseudoclavibacter sp. AY1F1]|uniref:AI-2E family transporter n=1 Tax=Pseudoclavibacter sp. AY1F1 TaxID=2080583 RepID=UPI000CE921DC|nr:AI-2E family transporter [Pseudoclavibacter sp. AY1F1]PPF46016.1 AI-2E family transporter [Pseudoclavibacter sp. AY1F1]